MGRTELPNESSQNCLLSSFSSRFKCAIVFRGAGLESLRGLRSTQTQNADTQYTYSHYTQRLEAYDLSRPMVGASDEGILERLVVRSRSINEAVRGFS